MSETVISWQCNFTCVSLSKYLVAYTLSFLCMYIWKNYTWMYVLMYDCICANYWYCKATYLFRYHLQGIFPQNHLSIWWSCTKHHQSSPAYRPQCWCPSTLVFNFAWSYFSPVAQSRFVSVLCVCQPLYLRETHTFLPLRSGMNLHEYAIIQKNRGQEHLD